MPQTPTKHDPRSLSPWFVNPSVRSLREEVDDLFHNFFGESGALVTQETVPKLDVSETAEAVDVTTDIPGFQPEDIEIEVHEQHLTISGKHTDETKEDNKERKFHRVERRSGSFSRSVWLPCLVQEDKIDAEMKDGVLKVHLPKAHEAKRRRIPIRAK